MKGITNAQKDISDLATKSELSAKADQSALDSTNIEVAKKANQSDLTVLQTTVEGKQDKLTPGEGIDITENTISISSENNINLIGSLNPVIDKSLGVSEIVVGSTEITVANISSIGKKLSIIDGSKAVILPDIEKGGTISRSVEINLSAYITSSTSSYYLLRNRILDWIDSQSSVLTRLSDGMYTVQVCAGVVYNLLSIYANAGYGFMTYSGMPVSFLVKNHKITHKVGPQDMWLYSGSSSSVPLNYSIFPKKIFKIDPVPKRTLSINMTVKKGGSGYRYSYVCDTGCTFSSTDPGSSTTYTSGSTYSYHSIDLIFPANGPYTCKLKIKVNTSNTKWSYASTTHGNYISMKDLGTDDEGYRVYDVFPVSSKTYVDISISSA